MKKIIAVALALAMLLALTGCGTPKKKPVNEWVDILNAAAADEGIRNNIAYPKKQVGYFSLQIGTVSLWVEADDDGVSKIQVQVQTRATQQSAYESGVYTGAILRELAGSDAGSILHELGLDNPLMGVQHTKTVERNGVKYTADYGYVFLEFTAEIGGGDNEKT